MSIIKFESNFSSFLIQGDRRFFLISLGNRPFLVADNCPHRGGPLHLGHLDCEKGTITCPWHNQAVPIQQLQQHAVPLVWCRDVAVAVLPGAESTSVVVKRRYVLVCASDLNQ